MSKNRVVHVEVTQADIDAGQRECGDTCAVALAIRRVLPDTAVFADVDWIDVDWDCAPTPGEVAVFMTAFDEGDPVEPFEFDLTLSERS